MRRWLDRLAVLLALLLIGGLLLACWMPAYVGAGGPHSHGRLGR